MKKVVDDLRLMIKVCDLYYNQNKSQQEIASLLNISRPTLSRLLSRAKEENLIRIEVANVELVDHWELGERLKDKYNLKDVIIAHSGEDRNETKINIGKIAASYIERTIRDGDVVGISMGSTLYETIFHMKECKDNKKIKVFPLVGGVGQANLELHSNTLAESFSKLYNSDFQPIFAPARVFSQIVRNELMKDLSMRNMIKSAEKMNIAILGIGYPNEHSSIAATGYFAENEMETLIERKVAGEINMQFYDISGNTGPFKDNNYVIGLEVQKLRKTPISIGIAGGLDKVDAIRGAIAGGYINRLITDYNCAKALLEQKETK